MSNQLEIFIDTTAEHHTRSVWTHKTYEMDREIWANIAERVHWLNIASLAMTFGAATYLAVDSQASLFNVSIEKITIIIGTISFFISLYQGTINPEKKELLFRSAAKEHLVLRDKFKTLIERAKCGEELITLSAARSCLLEARDMVHKWAPDTSSEAYKRASKALKHDEHFTIHESEKDMFLPKTLKSTHQQKAANE